MDGITKLAIGTVLFLALAIAAVKYLQPGPKQQTQGNVSYSRALTERIADCKQIANGYIAWRAKNTVGSWEPLGTDTIDAIEKNTEHGPDFIVTGVVKFRHDGTRKESSFVCHVSAGETRMTMTSGILNGVSF